MGSPSVAGSSSRCTSSRSVGSVCAQRRPSTARTTNLLLRKIECCQVFQAATDRAPRYSRGSRHRIRPSELRPPQTSAVHAHRDLNASLRNGSESQFSHQGIVTLTKAGEPAEYRSRWRNENSPDPHYRHRFPAEVISHAVWLYHVFSLSLRDVELILAQRGVFVSYETIRRLSEIRRELRARSPPAPSAARRQVAPGRSLHPHTR